MAGSAPISVPISVIVPCYNHAAYIDQCLASIDAQNVDGLEVILIDDGSKDDTWAHIEAFRFRPDRRVHKIRQANAGAHVALNRGLRLATGRYLTICNSDDYFAPERFSRLQNVLDSSGGQFAFSGVRFVSSENRDVTREWEYAADIAKKQQDIETYASVGFSLMLTNVAVSTGNFFFRRELWKQVGEFRPYRYCHDWDFILRALLVTEPLYVPDPLYCYRLHPSNSYLALAEAAARECPELMRRFLKAACQKPTPNRACPSPANWPVYFDYFIKQHAYGGYMAGWTDIDEPYYADVTEQAA